MPQYPGSSSSSGGPDRIGPVKKGALHRALGLKAGAPIPTRTLERLKRSPSQAMRKRANFALAARKWNHGG